MSKAINKLKELYLFAVLANPDFVKDTIGEPIFHTESVPGLIKCISSYIELKGFELNHNKDSRFAYGVHYTEDDLIRAIFKGEAIYCFVKYSDEPKGVYEINLEKGVKECGAFYFLALVTNTNSFDDFVKWFDKEINVKEV